MVTGEGRENYHWWWLDNQFRSFGSLFDLFYGYWFPVHPEDGEDYFTGTTDLYPNEMYQALCAKYGADKVEPKYTPEQRRQRLNSGWGDNSFRVALDRGPAETDDCRYTPGWDYTGDAPRYRFGLAPECNGCCNGYK